MDFLEVIEKRHSVRKYSDRPVEKEDEAEAGTPLEIPPLQ